METYFSVNYGAMIKMNGYKEISIKTFNAQLNDEHNRPRRKKVSESMREVARVRRRREEIQDEIALRKLID